MANGWKADLAKPKALQSASGTLGGREVITAQSESLSAPAQAGCKALYYWDMPHYPHIKLED